MTGCCADVERQVAAARARRVERAALVEIERDGIDDQPVGRPRGQVEPGSDFDGHALAGRLARRAASAGVSRTIRLRRAGSRTLSRPVLPGVQPAATMVTRRHKNNRRG